MPIRIQKNAIKQLAGNEIECSNKLYEAEYQNPSKKILGKTAQA
jgi:hypothetical protein